MADVILTNNEGVSLESLELSVVRTNGVLTANFDMLEAAIDKKMDDYRLVQYSDDAEQQKKELKQDRAALNKLTASLKGMKKEVKEEFMKPWTEFESRLTKILTIIEEPKLVIDEKIKELEDAGREEKRKQIRDYWVVISAVIEEVDFREQLYARLYNPSWENATATQKAFKEALKKGVDEYVYGMKCLKLSNHEFMEDGIREFQLSLDLSKAINLMEDKKKQKEELLKKEEERLAAERLRIEAEAKAKAEREAAEALAAERARIEAEAKAKAEAEANAKMEAEKLRIEAEAKEKAEAEAKKNAFTVQQTSTAPTAITPHITVQTASADKTVTVTFNASGWAAVQKYADRLGITYTVK